MDQQFDLNKLIEKMVDYYIEKEINERTLNVDQIEFIDNLIEARIIETLEQEKLKEENLIYEKNENENYLIDGAESNIEPMDCDYFFAENQNEIQYLKKNDDFEIEERDSVAEYAISIDEILDLNTLEKEAKKQINNPKSTQENSNQIYYENIKLEKQREKNSQKQCEKHQKELEKQQEKYQKDVEKQLIKQQKELRKQKEKFYKQEDKNFLIDSLNKVKQLLSLKGVLNQNEKNKDESEYVLDGDDDEYFKLQLELAQALSEADAKQLVQTKYDNEITGNEVMEAEKPDYFKQENQFECKICFETYLKSDCFIFNCNHMYCRDCIQEYLTSQINDGQTEEFKCPDTNCDVFATDDLVEQVLDIEILQKLNDFRFRGAIGKIDEINYCPKCQKPVQCEIDMGMGSCECGFVFCTNCLKEYHGSYDCGTTEHEKVLMLQKYQKELALEEERKRIAQEIALEAERIRIEQEAERQRIAMQQAIEAERRKRQTESEQSEDFVRRNFKKCPHCYCDVEKISGCNHMTCTKCRGEFCWICLVRTRGSSHNFSH